MTTRPGDYSGLTWLPNGAFSPLAVPLEWDGSTPTDPAMRLL